MEPLPYLTRDWPGTGGRIKAEAADFMVEEIPLYLPSGEGQHCYAFVEKRDISTHRLVSQIARALGVQQKAIGYAGLKDARAVTRQMISIDGVTPERVEALRIPGVSVLSAVQHRNKLKLGHLKGNKFTIWIRDVDPHSLPDAENVLATLESTGVPNYFGTQRFCIRDNSHWLGLALLRGDAEDFIRQYLGCPQSQEAPDIQAARSAVDAGDYQVALDQWPAGLRDERRVLALLARQGGDPARAVAAVDKNMRRFFMSAYQSYLFNSLLAQRIETIGRLELGDVAYIHPVFADDGGGSRGGGAFIVQDLAVEQPRADRFEISPSGPMFGPNLLQAEGEPGRREREALALSGLTLSEFRLPGIKQKGARRPCRVPLREARVDWDNGLRLEFSLPPGSYATEVLREIMKND